MRLAPVTRPAHVLVASLLLALGSGCGHKGDPLPPLRRTPPLPSGFRLAQRGDAIELAARAPSASVDGVPYRELTLEFLYGTGEIDLEKAGHHLLVPCAAGSAVGKTVPLPPAGTLLRATVRAIADGQKGARALTQALVVQAPLEAPRELAAAVTEGGVDLTWKGPRPELVPPPPVPARPGLPRLPSARPVPGAATTPGPSPAPTPSPSPTPAGPQAEGAAGAEGSQTTAKKGGFLVYRRVDGAGFAGPLEATPLDRRRFVDTTAPLGVRACYVVRAAGSTAPLVESASSNEACVVMRDIAPPAAPTGVTVLPRSGGLEIVWSPSGEPDLAGYRVFRSTGGERVLLAELGAAKSSYLDTGAKKDVRYRYTVVAFDAAGNPSRPSEPVEAGLP